MGNHLKGFRHFTTMEIPEYFQNKNFSPSIQELPTKKLSIVVVIPSFNEADLKDSLMALASCSKPRGDVEVIVVVNHPENSSAEVVTTSEQSLQVVAEADSCWGSSSFRFYAIKAFNLPQKQAGVGLARQIGMDEAAYRLFLAKQPGGIIACFDADATCEVNYLVELENFWAANPDIHACSIRFEHPIQGNNFPQEVYDGIAQYELHLRYYNQALRYTGFPFAFHTVGSSMACTAEAYVKFGGMNRHQAGEDFYFLQKIIPHGHFAELNTTCIYPSPRASNRVPFGTGKSMAMFLENPGNEIQTYQLESFFPLQMLFGKMQSLYQLDVGQIDC
ncbi:MAG TPA: glycosyltransferase family A protein, partial [Tenuifilaceae bacterium]|nr:glycosyltransferase family A protein [Tenuifilaceae bacterium]